MSIPRKIIIAGSTGHLGKALVEVGLEKGFQIRALARHPEVLSHYKSKGKLDIVNVDVTHPEELRRISDGYEIVISALGITRQKDKVTFMDIDYQSNLNLLEEAKSSGIKKFVYTSGFGVEENLDIALFKAKYKFELELKKSGMPYVIVRPTGFFSDILEFFEMAKKGRIILLGHGNNKMNPIDPLDLAGFIYEHLDDVNSILPVGGPDTMKINDIAEMAFDVLEKTPKITHLPRFVVKLLLGLIRLYSFKTFTILKFMTRFMNEDVIAPSYGYHHLKDVFKAHI
jgi:uncharacterized protein YbjT (DUF2867 family)